MTKTLGQLIAGERKPKEDKRRKRKIVEGKISTLCQRGEEHYKCVMLSCSCVCHTRKI